MQIRVSVRTPDDMERLSEGRSELSTRSRETVRDVRRNPIHFRPQVRRSRRRHGTGSHSVRGNKKPQRSRIHPAGAVHGSPGRRAPQANRSGLCGCIDQHDRFNLVDRAIPGARGDVGESPADIGVSGEKPLAIATNVGGGTACRTHPPIRRSSAP